MKAREGSAEKNRGQREAAAYDAVRCAVTLVAGVGAVIVTMQCFGWKSVDGRLG